MTKKKRRSANFTDLRSSAPQKISRCKKHNHIRCLAHVINLAAQDALTVLKVGYLENDNEIYNQIDQNNEIGISGVIPKLRNLVNKIHSSPLRREKFSRQCEVANLPNKELVQDVKTRWNSTFLMIERSCELREALDNTGTGDRDLRKWVLLDSEWCLLNEIKNLLNIFSRATEHISHGKFPTLENSVPIYNWLMDEIEKFQNDANIKIEVKNAALKAMEKLKKYYKDTDALPYTVTTILDPRLKLQYYIDTKWENKYIEAAQKDLNILYKTKYAPSTKNMMILEYPEDSLLQHIYKRQRVENNNELDQYLATPTAPYGTDILQWWKV
ncbi:unnamed protein product [Rhizophagus irregularis]|nr:unnamed protein product [Rhizophagus irregularis]